MTHAWLRFSAPLAIFASVHTVALTSVLPAFAQTKPTAGAGTDLLQRAQKLFDEQQYEESIQVLSAALVRPGNTKAQKVEVYRLLMLNYITLGKKDEADAAVRGLLAIQPDYELPASESPRFRDFFKTARDKWVADGKPGVVTDAEPAAPQVQMQHTSPSQVEPRTEVALSVKLDDPKGRVDSVKLFYRVGSKDKFTEVDADIDEGTARAKIPPSAVKPPFIEYYFLGYDKKGLAIVSRGDVGAPLRIAVPEPSKGWVLPVAIGGGILVVGGAFAIAAFAGAFKSSSTTNKPGQSNVSIGVTEMGGAGFRFH
jgi:tetratricopeptide (TPR) repeat protein